jgi:hypothetical protein
MSEVIEGGPEIRRRAASKSVKRFAQKRLLERAYVVILDGRHGELGSIVQPTGIEKAIAGQPWERYEQLISGERRG